MKTVLILTLLVAGVALGAGCSNDDPTASSSNGRIRVAAAFYPLAEAARQVGGDDVKVTDLTPPGVEPHDLELTTTTLDQVLDADVVLLMGRGFQPAVEDAAARRKKETVTVLSELASTRRLRGDVAEEGAGDTSASLDPHVWLDPVQMGEIVDLVAASLSKIDAPHAGVFRANADAYQAKLDALDAEMRDGLTGCQHTDIVTAHAAFGWLAARYGLHQEGIVGIIPDEEPDPRRMATLANLVQERGITTIFTESLVSPRVAKALANEAGVKTAVLDPLEGLTKSGIASGASYLSVMRDNLHTLEEALGCR